MADQGESAFREGVSESEWAVRLDLAACYRLASLFGWDDLVFTHMTARVPGTSDYLINPMGLMFDEVLASNLLKISASGEILQDQTGPRLQPRGLRHSWGGA
jgi:ribulose-5-phosphate 4-epimerase/fuculose-1-phosphate aldolase